MKLEELDTRTFFALVFMHGMLANPNLSAEPKAYANSAVEVADDLLERLKRDKPFTEDEAKAQTT